MFFPQSEVLRSKSDHYRIDSYHMEFMGEIFLVERRRQGCENRCVTFPKNSPQRLRYFSKRGETLKIFCLSDRREAAKDFWLSVLARPVGHETATYSTDRIPCPPASTNQTPGLRQTSSIRLHICTCDSYQSDPIHYYRLSRTISPSPPRQPPFIMDDSTSGLADGTSQVNALPDLQLIGFAGRDCRCRCLDRPVDEQQIHERVSYNTLFELRSGAESIDAKVSNSLHAKYFV
jgi:hypothetical protein